VTTLGSLWLHDNTWHLDAQPHVHMRAKRVFGRLKAEARGVLTLRSSPEVCADLLWFSQRYPLVMDATSRDVLQANASSYHETLLTLEDLIGPNQKETDLGLVRHALTKPARTYQAKEAQVLLALGGLLVGDDVGLGKTITAIEVAAHTVALPTLVVCQPHLLTQWAEKFAEFAPTLTCHIVKKKMPYQLPQFFGRRPDVLFISYYTITAGWAKILAHNSNFVVFDEVQELRHRETQRYRAAQELCEGIRYKLGLSATPIYNYGGEIFSIISLLRPDVLGSYEEFFQEWCAGYRDKPKLAKPKAFGTWAKNNFIIMRHRRKLKGAEPHPDDVSTIVGHELDPCQRIVHTVDTDRHVFDDVKGTAAALARTILSKDALDPRVKWEAARDLSVMLRQSTGIAKAPYVADFVRMLLEQGEPVVLCGWHRAVYDIWFDKLADFEPLRYTGTEGATAKDAAKKAFMAGRSKLLILSLRSGAGLDGLQEVCSNIVFGELDWSPGVHKQCIGRIYRDGQDEQVMAYFLVAEDGADPTMVEMLGLKREQEEGIMNPSGEFLEQVDEGGDHVRRLAAAYLKQVTGGPRRKESVA
jgi:hypothetical protein